MKRSRFTEEQVIAALKEHTAGASTKDLCRRLGIATETLYNWKRKYGGGEGDEAGGWGAPPGRAGSCPSAASAGWWPSAGRAPGTGPDAAETRSSGSVCGNWPGRGGGSVTGGASSCSGGKGGGGD